MVSIKQNSHEINKQTEISLNKRGRHHMQNKILSILYKTLCHNVNVKAVVIF